MEPSRTKESIARSSVVLFCGQLLARAATFAYIVVAARHLSVAELGIFSALQALAILAPAVWDFGVSDYVSRSSAFSGGTNPRAVIIVLLKARLLSSPFLVAVWIGGLYLLLGGAGSAPLALVLAMVAIALFINAGMIATAILQAVQQFREVALCLVISRVMSGALLLMLLWLNTVTPVTLACGIAIGELAFLILQANHLRSIVIPRDHWRPPRPKTLLGQAMPFAINSISNLVYAKLDVYLVAVIASAMQAGIYAPASRIQDAMALAPAVIATVIMPISARRHGAGQADRRLIKRASLGGVALVAPAILCVFALAPRIVRMGFGPGYEGTVWPLRIISLSILFHAAAAPIFADLVASGHVRRLNTAYLAALAFALMAHVALDARYGAVGAAVIAVVRDALAAATGWRVWATARPAIPAS